MAWTDGDLKILAAGLAIGGKYNHTHGTLPRVRSTYASGEYRYIPELFLYSEHSEATIYYRTTLMPNDYILYSGERIRITDTLNLLAFAAYNEGLSPLSVFRYKILPTLSPVDIIHASLIDPQINSSVDMFLNTIIIQEEHAIAPVLPNIIDGPFTIIR